MRLGIVSCLALPIMCVGAAYGQTKPSTIEKAILEGCRSYLVDKLSAENIASKAGLALVETSRFIVKYDAGMGVKLAFSDIQGTRGCSVEVAVSDLDADRKAIADAFARWSPPLRRGPERPLGGYAVRDTYCAEQGNEMGLVLMRRGSAEIAAGVSVGKGRPAACTSE